MAKVIFEGKEYNSATEACAFLGINQHSLPQIKKRWNLNTAEAIHYILENTKPKKTFEYDGIKYKSLGEACRKKGLPAKSVYTWKSVHKETATAAFEHYLNGHNRIYTKKER